MELQPVAASSVGNRQVQVRETAMTKFSEPAVVRVRDPKEDRDQELIPTREEIEQARKLAEEVRRGKADQAKSDKSA
jgi:hypothetical protein